MTVSVERPATTSAAPSASLRKRDRYIDSLRALALVRVMTYHVFGWAWLPILFPSMGIMFALAGSLVAGSLDRSPGNPWRVLKKRGIRLLPPLWLFGLVVVPLMLVAGWTHTASAGAPLHWRTLLFWVLPVSDPPGSAFGDDWVTPLWYIRAYLWFLLLSPALLWLFRHWPKRMLVLPVAVLLLSAVGLVPLNGRSGDVILNIAMFASCWMLGFAHHDNKIRPMPLGRVLAGGAALMALGLAWALTHQDPVSGYDIDNIPVADTLYCLGAVLILLRLYPDFSWMDRRVVLDKLVTVINSRAMTIYLWGNFAIFLSNPLLDRWSVTAGLDQESALGYLQMYVAAWLIVVACVVVFGWVEDLAARRPCRINPWPRSRQQLETLRTHRVVTFPHLPGRPQLTVRRLFLMSAGLLAAAGTASAVALAGTHTPGRTSTGDVPPRAAIQPRGISTPPSNLGQGNGQTLQPPGATPAATGGGSAPATQTLTPQPTGTGAPNVPGAPTGAALLQPPTGPRAAPVAGTGTTPVVRPTPSTPPPITSTTPPPTSAPPPSTTAPPSTTTPPPPSTTPPPPTTTTAPPPSTTTPPPPSTTPPPPSPTAPAPPTATLPSSASAPAPASTTAAADPTPATP